MLDMYNRIWEEGKMPKTCKYAKETALPKEGKTQKSLNKHTLQNIWKDEKQETGFVPGKGE